ncbi:MAG: hypothetical protein ACR2J8_02290 [Thermomicrobiales bacterium]
MGDGTGSAGRDILLVGPPRSGTTLACRLLASLPGVVALNEPQVPGLT